MSGFKALPDVDSPQTSPKRKRAGGTAVPMRPSVLGMQKGIHRTYVHSAHNTQATIKAVYSLSYHMPPPPPVQWHSAYSTGLVNMRVGRGTSMRHGVTLRNTSCGEGPEDCLHTCALHSRWSLGSGLG